jgi:hypothetical protein
VRKALLHRRARHHGEIARIRRARLLRAYPDLHITIEDLIEEGDKGVCRDTVSGTHQGEYMGIPPTGKSVTYNEIFNGAAGLVAIPDSEPFEVLGFTIIGGKIVEIDILTDHARLAQLDLAVFDE